MSEPFDLHKYLKKIDPSDVRFLAIGVVLLVIPVVVFFWRTAAPEGGFAGSGMRDRLNVGRGGFSFVQKQEAGRGGSRSGAPGSLYKSAKVDTQWSSAIEGIRNAPVQMPAELETASLETKWVFQADQDPELRQANCFLNTDRLKEAMQLYQKVLARDTDNPFMKFYASSNLCTVYERLGMTDNLEKEFRRMLALMSKMPKLGFEAEIARGMQGLDMIGTLMDKIQADPNLRLFVQQMLHDKGLTGRVNVDTIMADTAKSVIGVPGLGTIK
ncbi:MAG: hypothetical protein GX442_19265 [Candidatus Riflebacteria bacterium]|nr:hypothetical protein [Candidatus Riflebacteria bacterium]